MQANTIKGRVIGTTIHASIFCRLKTEVARPLQDDTVEQYVNVTVVLHDCTLGRGLVKDHNLFASQRCQAVAITFLLADVDLHAELWSYE